MSDSTSVGRVARLREVYAAMRSLAEEGCTGSHDGACCDPEMDIHPKEWCKRCLMGFAVKAAQEECAKQLRELLTKALVPVPDSPLHVPPCPNCGSTLTCRWINHSGVCGCYNCHHRWPDVAAPQPPQSR